MCLLRRTIPAQMVLLAVDTDSRLIFSDTKPRNANNTFQFQFIQR